MVKSHKKAIETSQQDYNRLYELSRHARILQGIASLLDWDQETYMPPGAAEIRSEQLKTIAGLVHREKTGKKFSTALSKLVDIQTGQMKAKGLTDAQNAAIREWKRDYVNDTALPASFVEEFAQLTSQGISAWRAAKQNNAFDQFVPYLERIVQMCRKKADLIGYQDHPYDALLDHYEPDMQTKQVHVLFTKLRQTLSPLIKQIQARKQVKDQFLFDSWDREEQIAFSYHILDAIGYDRKKGRLDFSSHPFSSSSHPTDSRITTRMETNSVLSNISVVLHEGGHGLYEMGLPQEAYGSPLGEARSLGIHESQSRFWETRIGLTKPFWKYFFPLLKETFKGQLDSVTLDEFYKGINKVESSFIRVEADELTYPLHIILRFELEKNLIEGSLNVRDIPDAWNAKMEEYLGVVPKTDREGCLQDIHWSMGGIGYFPTYTLGNMYAAHLFNGFAKDHLDWETRIESGELSFIKLWLHEKIYKHGRQYPSLELLQRATGKKFSVEPYIQYLRQKYTEIYQLNVD